MILERTQSVFGRSLVQVFKIANYKSFLKSKAIKTKKIRSTVVEGNYFRSKKNNSSSYHANFLSQVIISRFKRSRMLDLEIQKKITTITIFGHENLMKCCLYLHFTVNTSYFFPHAFTVDMYIQEGKFKWYHMYVLNRVMKVLKNLEYHH